jgi:hypothetical protein
MDDDFVAEVLAKEARENSQKYSAEGLSAYMPRKLVLCLKIGFNVSQESR